MLSTLLCHSGNLSRRSRRGYQLKILLTASPWTQAVGFYGKTSSTLEDKLLMLDLFLKCPLFGLHDACCLVSISGQEKGRFQIPVFLAKGHTRNPKSKHQRYQRVFAMPVLSGNAGSTYLKRQRHAARIKEEDAEWMSVLSHNTVFTNLDSIFVTDIEPVGLGGGYKRDSVDVHLSPT